MQDELRKVAQELRRQADQYDQQKLVKTAKVLRASVGLTLLKRKIGR